MIYLDNGATSYPKPANVLSSSVNALKNYSFNSGRGGYSASVNTAEKIYSVREKIGNMFHYEPQNVAFTLNCTMALNMAIKGSVCL
ncbi:MAG: aminotransferase class V-fold PLP-dependent enzyme, partial [Eubacterium sp.]|nr:aminotransferase class V-fold PLP-dependent enzyme [Eubacterium sp.]